MSVFAIGDSATTHDFFFYDTAGDVWDGAAFVAWADGDFADYRVAATQQGTSSRFEGTAPTNAVSFELRERGATLALSPVVFVG
jgi:hypothetical protein